MVDSGRIRRIADRWQHILFALRASCHSSGAKKLAMKSLNKHSAIFVYSTVLSLSIYQQSSSAVASNFRCFDTEKCTAAKWLYLWQRRIGLLPMSEHFTFYVFIFSSQNLAQLNIHISVGVCKWTKWIFRIILHHNYSLFFFDYIPGGVCSVLKCDTHDFKKLYISMD